MVQTMHRNYIESAARASMMLHMLAIGAHKLTCLMMSKMAAPIRAKNHGQTLPVHVSHTNDIWCYPHGIYCVRSATHVFLILLHFFHFQLLKSKRNLA